MTCLPNSRGSDRRENGAGRQTAGVDRGAHVDPGADELGEGQPGEAGSSAMLDSSCRNWSAWLVYRFDVKVREPRIAA